MTRAWADEFDWSDPLPALESFYILVALQLGDPDAHRWLERCAAEFHKLYNTYRINTLPDGNRLPDGATVLIQYFVWYAREQRD